MESNSLVDVLDGRADAVRHALALLLAVWTTYEVFRTLRVWSSSVTSDPTPQLAEVAEVAGVAGALNEARGQRAAELVVLGAVVVTQGVHWVAANTAPTRWSAISFSCAHAASLASLLLVASQRRRAVHKLRAALARAKRLAEQALTLKRERGDDQ